MAELALRNGYIVVPAHMRKGFSAKREKGEEPKDPKRVPHSYFVTPTIRECLEALLRLSAAENAPLDGGPSPLVWGDGQALSVRSYQVRLKLWAREAGLPGGVSPHWLRHTRAMNMIRRSRSANPLKVAQLALGHASLSSTGIYTQMSREEFERDLLAIDGKRLSRKAAVAAAQGSQGVLL
jgi:integrase